mmetsp:Transcript_39408/g.91372  ORF Transcript_39408/g.91372 Transcript_39408/m.91372 type:complete len:246 (-) Transcript_39408:382-1119(-)
MTEGRRSARTTSGGGVSQGDVGGLQGDGGGEGETERAASVPCAKRQAEAKRGAQVIHFTWHTPPATTSGTLGLGSTAGSAGAVAAGPRGARRATSGARPKLAVFVEAMPARQSTSCAAAVAASARSQAKTTPHPGAPALGAEGCSPAAGMRAAEEDAGASGKAETKDGTRFGTPRVSSSGGGRSKGLRSGVVPALHGTCNQGCSITSSKHNRWSGSCRSRPMRRLLTSFETLFQAAPRKVASVTS